MARNKQFKGIGIDAFDDLRAECVGAESYLASPYRSFIELQPPLRPYLAVMWRVVAIVNAITP